MSQKPQNPRPAPPNPVGPVKSGGPSGTKETALTAAQRKREEQRQIRFERERREREAARQRRLYVIIGMVIVIVLVVAGVTFFVLKAPDKNTNSSVASNTGAGAQSAAPATSASGAATTGGVPPVSGNEITTASGLKYIDTVVGTGASPTTGQQVTVNYTGYLTNGTKFDSSVDRNQPFNFNIGTGGVIKGWDEGVATMKVGGKRRLIIPPALGYGASGAGGVIPPNATLIFDVELLSVG